MAMRAISARRRRTTSMVSTQRPLSSQPPMVRDTGSPPHWAAVFNYGDVPNDGGMSGTHLNGAIIAGTGF